jgi:hypothetical protein
VIGEPYQASTPVVVNAATLQQAQGVYGVDPPGPQEFSRQGARVLRVVNGKLTVAHTGSERSELTPVSADTFQARDGFDRVQLVRDATGGVSALRSFPWGEPEGLLLARVGTPLSATQITVPRAELERVAGAYSGGGMTLHVFVDGDQLKADLGQPPAISLLAESPHRFFVAEVDSTLEFDLADGLPRTATLRQGNETVVFERKP